MKRHINSILLLVVLLVQASCINNLLDYPATTKISADTFWETTEDAEKGVNSELSSTEAELYFKT